MLVEKAENGDVAFMIDDKEIWACAHQVMNQYGDAARFHAAQRADALFETNDQEGHKIWMRILNRIKELGQLTPPGVLH